MSIKNKKSKKLFDEAKKFMPGGVNSPVRSFKAVGGTPRFIKRGKGAYIYDADDNQLLDFTGSWGPLILGHSITKIKRNIKKAIDEGTSFGTPTLRETELAKLIINSVQSIEKIRFVNSGTEATMSAVRLARGYTKRELIIKFEGCYHGHADMFLSNAGSGLATFDQPTSPGVPRSVVESTITIDFNDLKSVEKAFKQYPNEIAAVIIEPITGNMSVIKPKLEFINGLRKLTKQNGSLLIFDEVMTGFRVANGGAQKILNIKPDITALGKIIGGGLPVGAYGGSNDIMSYISPEGPVYQAGTLSGNPVSMSAGIATLKELKNKKIYEHLEKVSKYFCKGLQNIAESNNVPIRINQFGSMVGIFFSNKEIHDFKGISKFHIDTYNKLHNFLLNNNVYFPPSAYEGLFISYAHKKKHMNYVLNIFEKFCRKIPI